MTPGAVEMEVGGRTFFYDRGIFFRHLANRYIVVHTPVGALVDALPRGTEAAMLGDDIDTYFYFFGTFFARKGDTYEVVAPTPGVKVWYVPDGYTEIDHGDGIRYQFGDHTFEPVWCPP